MLPDLGDGRTLYLILGAVLLAGLIARRVPVMRAALSIASWVVPQSQRMASRPDPSPSRKTRFRPPAKP